MGLGSEYERLVRSGGGSPRERRAIALRAASFGYRLASWLVSLLVVVVAFFAAFGITEAFTSGGWALLAAFVVLVLLAVAWRRSWRRYRAPLIRMVPRSEYARFAEWQSHHEPEPDTPRRSWKLDLRLLKRVERQK
jgi:hypothetical protein